VLSQACWIDARLLLAVAVALGTFNLAGNFVHYVIMAKISPPVRTLAANLTRVGIVLCSFILGLENWPDDPWEVLFLLGLLSSAACFSRAAWLIHAAARLPREKRLS